MDQRTELLADVTRTAAALATARAEWTARMQAWVEEKINPELVQNDMAVLAALYAGISITDVASAYSPTSRNPNRNAIYAIKKRHEEVGSGGLPFEWVPREVVTSNGPRTLHDLHAELDDFGPHKITAKFRWRYDVPTGTLELDLAESEGTYPIHDTFYKTVLARWLKANPYPGGG